MLQDASAYTDPAKQRAKRGLASDIWVQAIAPHSPAALIQMPIDAELLGFGEVDIARDFPVTEPTWKRLPAIYGALEAALAESPTELRWRTRPGELRRVNVTAMPVCRTIFEVLSRGDGASADGKRALFGRDFAGFAYAEDELAAAAAHELAHNILRHSERLEARGRKRADIRLTERDADRMMPWLLANAGYGPRAAVRFLEKWGPAHDKGLFRKRTHDGWDERIENVEAQIVTVERLMADEGRADWSRHFVEESAAAFEDRPTD